MDAVFLYISWQKSFKLKKHKNLMEFRFISLHLQPKCISWKEMRMCLFFSLYKSLRRDGFCFAGMNLRM